MGKGFGKIKRLIKSKPSSPRNLGKVQENTPASTPESTPEVLKPVSVNYVASSDVTELKGNYKGNKKATNNEGSQVPLLAQQTDADDVLDGILQDLNITQLAVDAGRTDTVSEYSGGSAKSVETDSDEETDESDEETDEDGDDDDDEETDEDDEEEEAVVQKTKKKSSVGDRVAAVVAAAEEIRKNRVSPPNLPGGRTSPATTTGPGTKSGRSTPAESVQTSKQDSLMKKGSKASVTASKSSSKSPNKKRFPPTTSSRGPSPTKQNKLPPSSASKSRSQQQQQQQSKSNGRGTPQFSPGEKCFDDDAHTGDTEISDEEGTFASAESNTLAEDNTLGDLDNNTLGTDIGSYEDRGTVGGNSMESLSQNGDSTFDEEEDGRRQTTTKTVMNKDIIIHQPGGPSSLVVRAMYYTPLPASPEDIIIKVEASTVSFRDCLLRRGIGVDRPTFPFVPGCEVVGTISNVGKAARNEGYRVGDRVVGMTRRGGGNGYYAKFNTKNVSPVISTGIDPADVVCLVDVYMTAYQALRVGKKDGTPLTEANVLITDGFSPVGQATVALAKLEGANVYVTTTESRQDEYMKTLGVKCLPMAPSKWLHKIKGKMDIVIDNTCFDSYDSSWKALNPNGILVCTGMTSIYSFQDHATGSSGGCGCDAFGDMRDYQAKWASVKAKYMMSQTKFHDLHESFQKNPKKFQQELKYLCFLVDSGMLKPKIAERVSIEEVPDAQRYLETGKANGTIVCLP